MASPEEIERRNQLIPFLESLAASWVKSVYVERVICIVIWLIKKLDEFTVNQANAKVMPYGSFALGVSSISSDIDLYGCMKSDMCRLCIVPGEVNEKDFFSSFYALLSHNSRITELKAIPLAFFCVIAMKIQFRSYYYHGNRRRICRHFLCLSSFLPLQTPRKPRYSFQRHFTKR